MREPLQLTTLKLKLEIETERQVKSKDRQHPSRQMYVSHQSADRKIAAVS